MNYRHQDRIKAAVSELRRQRAQQDAAVIEAAQQANRSRYIRAGLKTAGYPVELADLADLLRGDRDALTLDMLEPGDRIAAEWFVKLLEQQQGNIRVMQRFGKWRS